MEALIDTMMPSRFTSGQWETLHQLEKMKVFPFLYQSQISKRYLTDFFSSKQFDLLTWSIGSLDCKWITLDFTQEKAALRDGADSRIDKCGFWEKIDTVEAQTTYYD